MQTWIFNEGQAVEIYLDCRLGWKLKPGKKEQMPRFALCIRNHETSSNQKLSDIIRNHQKSSWSSWSSYTNYINHIPTTYQYQAYTNPSSSASARAPMDTRKRTAKLTWELWPPCRISPWSIGFIGFTLWQITSNIINITNIDPENHQVFLKTDWKLIFQPLPGRVYVNLLEGNHEKWGTSWEYTGRSATIW